MIRIRQIQKIENIYGGLIVFVKEVYGTEVDYILFALRDAWISVPKLDFEDLPIIKSSQLKLVIMKLKVLLFQTNVRWIYFFNIRIM